MLAITLHNVPEGLAVGVAFGAAAANGAEIAGAGTLGAAIALTIGTGLQNFPEGVAVSMPLRAEGMSRLRSFWYGQLSALFEPLASVVGAAAVLTVRPLLPYALAFAAGAMIYVVIEELIPESHRGTAAPICRHSVPWGLYSDDDSRRGAEVKKEVSQRPLLLPRWRSFEMLDQNVAVSRVRALNIGAPMRLSDQATLRTQTSDKPCRSRS